MPAVCGPGGLGSGRQTRRTTSDSFGEWLLRQKRRRWTLWRRDSATELAATLSRWRQSNRTRSAVSSGSSGSRARRALEQLIDPRGARRGPDRPLTRIAGRRRHPTLSSTELDRLLGNIVRWLAGSRYCRERAGRHAPAFSRGTRNARSARPRLGAGCLLGDAQPGNVHDPDPSPVFHVPAVDLRLAGIPTGVATRLREAIA